MEKWIAESSAVDLVVTLTKDDLNSRYGMVNIPYSEGKTDMLVIKSIDEGGLLFKAAAGVDVGDAIVKVNLATKIVDMRQEFLKAPSVKLFILRNGNIQRFLSAAQ